MTHVPDTPLDRPDADRITKVELWPLDVPMAQPFTVATGQRLVAENVIVRITLHGGAVGYGEMAPFPEVGGEDRTACQRAAIRLAEGIVGQSVTRYQHLGRRLREQAPDHPAAHCGLETAILDALCRKLGIPLWGLWGGADVRPRETDITIPITDVEQTVALGHEWYSRGFRVFKTKVGTDVEQDIRRLEALHGTFPGLAFVVDANQGFTREECAHLVKETRRCGATIVLLEQPVHRDELDAMAALRRDLGVTIAADESARSLADVRDLLRTQAADVINLKITKTGLLAAMEMATFARAAGLGLMIGGMIETRVAMGCSFALVLGTGGFDILDLDTPLLLAQDPVIGGYEYSGPWLQPSHGPGLGLEMALPKSVLTIG